MSNSIFKRWMSIFFMVFLVIVGCAVAVSKVWFSHPAVKVDTSIMDVAADSENLIYQKGSNDN